MRTFVIAEAASCHDGDLHKAHRLILAAKAAGADACKFQFWSSADRLAARRHAKDYLAIYDRYRIPVDWLPLLKLWCDDAGLDFLCTTFLPEDIAVVEPFVNRFKIASFEATDHAFVAAHAKYKREVILSLGMATLDEVEDSLYLPINLSVLHCTSAYPAPWDAANLGVIRQVKQRYALPVGLSDHTLHEWTGALAVAAGAEIVEVHFMLDDTDGRNPDVPASHTPDGLKRYIQHIRLSETMMGDGVKCLQECEREMAKYRVIA